MSGALTMFRVGRLDLRFVPKPWAFADARRAEIDAYFAELQREKPAVWNGRVLLLHHQVVRDGVFHGEFLETDFASFAAWRHWGNPPAGVRDSFASAAIMSADGAFLLGVMGAHTASAGAVYFPAGTPDPTDIADGKVDFEASVERELMEETGCAVTEFSAEPSWTTVVNGTRIVQIKLLRSTESAEALRARILSHLAREAQPELCGIRIVRGAADFDPAMPRFVTAFMEQHFSGG